MKVVEKQACKLKFRFKWRIHLVFYVSLLEKDITRKQAENQKITDGFEFEEDDQPE